MLILKAGIGSTKNPRKLPQTFFCRQFRSETAGKSRVLNYQSHKQDLNSELRWSGNKAQDFDHYNVYESTKSNFAKTNLAGTCNTNSYSRTGLAPFTTYYYRVAPVDKAGNIGPLSSVESGKTADYKKAGNIDNKAPARIAGLRVRPLVVNRLPSHRSKIENLILITTISIEVQPEGLV